MLVTLIRHPTVRNPRKLCYGRLDLPLEDGWPERVRRWPMVGRVYTSPSWRCYVAARCAMSRGQKPQCDDRLREIDFGTWEGVPWESIPRDALDAWAHQPTTYRVGGGESADIMARRVTEFFHEVLTCGKDVVIVTHGGPLKVLSALCQGREWQVADASILPGDTVQYDLNAIP